MSVTLVDETDDNERIRVEVRDTGIGIEDCYRDSLFKVHSPFPHRSPLSLLTALVQVYSQSGADIRRKFGGSGLGNV